MSLNRSCYEKKREMTYRRGEETKLLLKDTVLRKQAFHALACKLKDMDRVFFTAKSQRIYKSLAVKFEHPNLHAIGRDQADILLF